MQQNLVHDTLAYSENELNEEDLLDEHLYETVQRHPSGLDNAPEVLVRACWRHGAAVPRPHGLPPAMQIHGDYEVFALDAESGQQIPLRGTPVLQRDP